MSKDRLFRAREARIQQEKGFVASLAFNNILEILNSAYLSLKAAGQELTPNNSFSVDTYSSLIKLGYWKKCLYMVDYENALEISKAFQSFDNYKRIALLGNSDFAKEVF
jgi:hypothetical protein